MKLVFLLGLLAVIAIFGFFAFSSLNAPKEKVTLPTSTSQVKEEVNIKASFAIFTNGTFRIFTASMYHNLSTDVYIDSSNPNIVNLKKVDVTWNDFFKTLPMKLTRECLTTGTGQTFCTKSDQKLKFYINGQLDMAALDKKIGEKDQLLVSYGSESDSEIEKQLQQISKVE